MKVTMSSRRIWEELRSLEHMAEVATCELFTKDGIEPSTLALDLEEIAKQAKELAAEVRLVKHKIGM